MATEEKALVGVRRQVTMPEEVSKAVGLEPGSAVRVRQTGPDTLEVQVLPRLTLSEMLELYPIEGPLDFDRVRQEAEEELADEIIRRIRYGVE